MVRVSKSLPFELALRLGFAFWGRLLGRLCMAYIDWDMERAQRRREERTMIP